ncbi:tetratricopeptide repeat protein [Pseudomonas stutzeri]|uniref:tetratricopeptide repeat protein n=1 Tax=Stutzerimonas stutzeri TaxID=316 RepID=UPI00190A0F35|nr:tetratricopeptide repeat protein [Stutzerimonas stutzeri]MBK3866610.1 tetratricopeptide repeat protein [Stutzerimonas stutzeri]
MSLVNDMLRDLEARGAASGGQSSLNGVRTVDEAALLRRQRSARAKRWLLPLVAVLLVALGVGLMFERLPLGSRQVEAPAAPAVVPAPPAATAVRLLDVLPHEEEGHFVLQLLLDRSVSYQRTDESGVVSLHLPGVVLAGEALTGRIEQNGLTLSWRVEPHDDEVRVLLIGMTDRLDIRDRLEPAGGHVQLWLEARLGGEPPAPADELVLPVAEAVRDEADWPDWVTRSVPDEPRAAAPAPEVRNPAEPVAAQVAAPEVSAKQSVQIGSHRPEPLAQAQDALRQQNYPRAIQLLQSLHATQPDNPQAIRWLARAYLASGQIDTLLAWLPGQLQTRPRDAELRMLLARGQLLGGDKPAALATLEQSLPALASNSAYHALLAALRQQVGDWAGSAAIYRQLVGLRPQQASWQLGLAIALEQLDQPALAADHYRLAAQGQGLDGNARRFAVERAAALGVAR